MTKTVCFFRLLMIFASSPLISSLENQISVNERNVRAAFDLGSGTFKLTIAEVIGSDIQPKFSKTIRVGLGLDLAESQSRSFSEKVQTAAFSALAELKKDAIERGATQFAGIATAAFRHAINGNDFLDKLVKEIKIPIRLISQEEEGILAFKTFLNVFSEINENNCIALDLGAASFQLTKKNNQFYDVIQEPLGVSGVLKIFSENIKNISFQRELIFTPITLHEIKLLIEEIEDKIFSDCVIQIQFFNKPFEVLYLDDWVDEIEQRTGQNEKISKAQIWDALIKTLDYINLNPSLKEQSFIMLYALLYSIMDKSKINHLRIKLHTTGNTLGMITEDCFWP